jgi:hypothetical protein
MTSMSVICPDVALAAYAPPEPVKVDNVIVVTGQKLSQEELRRQASAFVKQASAIPEEGQYAKRRDSVCAAISGIDPQYTKLVVAKVNQVAEAVGADVGKPGCTVNLLINFTTDADQFIRDVKRIRPGSLAALRPQERSALITSKMPVRWWYSTETRGSDNMPLVLGAPNSALLGGDGGGSLSIPTSNRGFVRTYSPSIIDTKIVVGISATVVVIDVEKSTGFPLDSVAAYAAMVSLAQIKLTSDYSTFPSILSMFSAAKTPDQAPRDLTEWDYAYLRALYKVQPNRTARVQRTRIFGEMVKELAK